MSRTCWSRPSRKRFTRTARPQLQPSGRTAGSTADGRRATTSTPIRLTLTVAGNTVTVAGTPSSPLNAAVLVNGKAYIYPLQANDTATSIATALAALINADTPASSSGEVV